jgi:hypothetical protein
MSLPVPPQRPDAVPFEEALSLHRLVQESRLRLGPGADVTGVVADLRGRGVDIDRADVVRVWDEKA